MLIKRYAVVICCLLLQAAYARYAMAQAPTPSVPSARNTPSSYPTKPMRFIVPFGPGGGTDVVARSIAQKLTESLGQQVVIENRPGAGSNIGAELVAHAAPDGYTMLLATTTIASSVALYPKLGYDVTRDLAPVSLVVSVHNLLIAHPSLPVHNVKELVALAKARPDDLNYGSGGNGTLGNLVAEFFKSETGTHITHVPYNGSGPAMTALLSGQVQVLFTSPGAAIRSYARAGRLRILAVASAQRDANMSDVPKFAESGYPQIVSDGWYGVLTTAGTPPDVITLLNREIVRTMQSLDVKERLAGFGFGAVSSTPEAFGTYIKSEITRWAKVVKVSGARID